MAIVEGLINGLDCSSIQVITNPKLIFDSGFQFAYVKSSQYSSTKDQRFDSIVERLRSAGLRVGAYHFCAQDSDPVAQANFFYRASGGLGKDSGDLPPMVDWEFCTPSKYKDHPQHCVTWLETMLTTCKELWYPDNGLRAVVRLPVVYSYPFYMGSHSSALETSRVLGEYPLCLASYTKGPILQTAESIPAAKIHLPWTRALLCQHKGDEGRVPGIAGACDMQVFLGSSGEWNDFLGLPRPPDMIEGVDIQ